MHELSGSHAWLLSESRPTNQALSQCQSDAHLSHRAPDKPVKKSALLDAVDS